MLGEIGVNAFWEGVTQVGLVAGLLCLFVWQSFKREDAMSKRLTEVENFQRGELLDLSKESIASLKEATTALKNSNDVIEGNKKAVEDNSRVMEKFCNKLDGISDSGFTKIAGGQT